MPHYRWKGVDLSGIVRQGVIEAVSDDQLAQTLLKQNIALLEHASVTKRHFFDFSFLGQRITQEQLCDFFERLALLIASGVELVQALNTLAQALDKTSLGNIASVLARDISAGQTFKQALNKHPHVFAPFIKHLVSTGEQTGSLAAVLNAIAHHLRQQSTLRQELKQASLGPLITLGTALGLMILILLFVTPQFESLYQSLGSPLPPATARLIAISTLLRSWYGAGILICFLLLVLGFKRLGQHKKLQLLHEQILIKAPVIGSIITIRHQILFMNTLSLFITSGVPLSTALENLNNLSSNHLFKADIQKIITAIVEGKSFSSAINSIHSYFFNQELAMLIAVGEKTGNLAGVFDKAGPAYQQLLTKKLQRLSTLFAPILMLIIGILITGLMVIMYLPIVNLGTLFRF